MTPASVAESFPTAPWIALTAGRSQCSPEGATPRHPEALAVGADALAVRPMVPDDVDAVVELQRHVYPAIPPWHHSRLRDQLTRFSQGQVVAESAGRLVGYAGSLVVLWDEWSDSHSCSEITSDGRFAHHNPQGRNL